jgi:threonine/homoserine/homoserine lactone efflux protein
VHSLLPLVVANSLRYGFRLGVHTVLGTTVGIGLQLALVVTGLVAACASSAGRYIAGYARLRNRLTGAFLTAAGIGLALSRR